jgi:hypothetical protein
MKTKIWLQALFLVLAMGERSSVSRASDECETVNIPPEVSVVLERSFSRWRIEKTSDLEPSNRETWTKKYPGLCPGFVAGHFQRLDSVAYAFLLLPADKTMKGYRVVAILESAKGRWHPIVIEKSDQTTPTSAVIGLAKPGEYREAEGSQKVFIQTDAIFSEDIGVGVLIYYWRGDRFRSLVISD